MCVYKGLVAVSEEYVGGKTIHTPLLIEELSCKLLSSHMHETCCTNQLTHSSPHETTHDLQE